MSQPSSPARRSSRWRHAAAVAAVAVTVPIATVSLSASDATALPSLNAEFVTREGTQLRLEGERFVASGANIYWLGLDENVGGVDFPTYFRIKDALDTAKQLGVNVVRSHMMTSTGQDNANPLALMPELGVYNEDAFKTIDYAIAYAGSIGVRLILPLTDEWSYYHGGHRDFTTPLGLESDAFYTAPEAVAAYQQYVDVILSRTNALTGVKYVDDPTVLAWELGNELEGMTLEWINENVDFIRDRAPQQLVAAGRRFDIDPDTLQAPHLDIVDVHYYPPTAEKIRADAATVAAAGKVYIGGEYASTAATDAVLQPAASDPNVSGMFFWSLFGNNDRGGLVPHDDGFTLHYPGTTDRMRTSVQAVQASSTALGLAVDTLEMDAPLITAIEQSNGINRIAWRGTAGAVGYRVERSVDNASWQAISGTVGAEASPVTDLDSSAGATYRVVAIAPAGATTASTPVKAAAIGAVLVDPLADWKLTAGHENAEIVPPSGALASGAASAEWNVSGITEASFQLSSTTGVTLSVSNDGQDWVEIPTTGNADTITGSDIGRDFVRISWSTGATLERATITSGAEPVAILDQLNDFSLSHAHTGSLSFDTGNPGLFEGDTSRLKRDADDGNESVTWTYDDISGVDITAFAWPDQPTTPLTLEVSTDGLTWRGTEAEVLGGAGNWRKFTYRLRDLTNVNYVRVSWPNTGGEVWTPQLSQAQIYSPNAPELTAPAAVALTAPENNLTDVQSVPTFSWETDPAAAYYRFTLSRSSDLADAVHTQTGLFVNSYQPAIDLNPQTRYYWQVEAVNGIGSGASEVRTFTTAALPTEPLIIEDFESYASDEALAAAYPRNTGGGTVTPTLTPNEVTGTTAARFAFALGDPGYAGVIRTLPAPQNWWGYRGLGLTLDAPVGASISLQFVAAGGYWESTVEVTEAGPQQLEVDFDDFAPPAWAGESTLDLSSATQFAIYVSDVPDGDLVIDDVMALAPLPVVVEPSPEPTDPEPTPDPTSPDPTSAEPTAPQPTDPTPSDTPSSSGTGSTAEGQAKGNLAATGAGIGAGVMTVVALALVSIGIAARRRTHTDWTL